MSKKGGRPRLPAADRRGVTIGVRVSEAECTELQAKAAAMNMTPAQWLRSAALSRRLPSPPPSPIQREQYAELARLAGNINQLTRLANTRYITADTELLFTLANELKQIRLALIGANSDSEDD